MQFYIGLRACAYKGGRGVKMSLLATLLVLSLPSLAEPVGVVSRYSSSWAVEVEGGDGEAERLAREHGFINRGQVGSLGTHYHFELLEAPHIATSDETWTAMTHALLDEATVRYAEQQIVKEHVKKDYIVPSDPGWPKQWVLKNTGKVKGTASEMLDMRVEQVWLQGYTGQGVTTAVVDDGLEWNHDDIMGNYDPGISYDHTSNSSDPSPASRSDSHGTECAGVIAMAKNSACGIGVAFQGRIGGIKIAIDESLDIVEARGLGFQQDRVDIYSNSWGPKDDGFTVEGPGTLVSMTFETGTKMGRNGNGNIYVWASGNGGDNHDSCAADGYVNSIHTIAVGSADQNGQQAYYDEDCSAKIAVTFSHNSNSAATQVFTTTINGGCTEYFTGTSASAPLMSGIIALALQANPDLTWRDVQYLIVYTSNPDILTVDDLATNGAGLKFSHHFGFGAVDAEAMVTRARHWINVPQQHNFTLSPTLSECVVMNRSSYELEFEVTEEANVSSLEHVVVSLSLSLLLSSQDPIFNLTDYYAAQENDEIAIYDWLRSPHPRRGDVELTLTSPSGTRSTLLPFRDFDFVNDEGYDDWPFMSVHFWGETPVGTWTLHTSYRSTSGRVYLTNVTLTGFGVYERPPQQDVNRGVCESCQRGCWEGVCDVCVQLRYNETLQCVGSCTNGTTEYNGYCITGDVVYPPPTDSTARTTMVILVSVAAIVVATLTTVALVVLAVAVVTRKRHKRQPRNEIINLSLLEDDDTTDIV